MERYSVKSLGHSPVSYMVLISFVSIFQAGKIIKILFRKLGTGCLKRFKHHSKEFHHSMLPSMWKITTSSGWGGEERERG